MEIKENITTRNYTRGNNRSIKYIVVHYVGAVSTAKNNSDYLNQFIEEHQHTILLMIKIFIEL